MTEPTMEPKPSVDPHTGTQIWTVTDAPVRPVTVHRDGRIQLRRPADAVDLPEERFAGSAPPPEPELTDWQAAATLRTDAPQGQIVALSPSGELVVTHPSGAVEAVQLPGDRFAADLPEIGSWRDTAVPGADELPAAPPVTAAADGTLRLANGSTTVAVQLPEDRFAGDLGPSSMQQRHAEAQTVRSLRESQVRWVKQLAHTSMVDGMPTAAPTGWLYRPRANRYGDQLVCVLAYHPRTDLYHAHYWRFEADVDGHGVKAIDLPRYLGRHPDLTHHKAHLYTSEGRDTAVLCLSTRVYGGMPTLETALVQTLKWADGTGDVVRGRPFPFT